MQGKKSAPRRACAVAVVGGVVSLAAAPAPAPGAFAQASVDTRTIRVGPSQTSASSTASGAAAVQTVTVTMPAAPTGGAFLQSAALVPAPAPAGGPSNLGTFNIVLNATPALSANPAALAAFNRAADQWKARIADPITVRIDADLAPLGPSVLGQASSQLLTASYTTIRNQMVAAAAGEPDDLIVASLPTAANYTVTMPTGFSLNGNVVASKANLKAMGFDSAQLDTIAGTTSDASIAFSSTFAFDFDKSNGVSPGQIDFEGVAAHEIGHALGFFSSVDDVDFVLPGTASVAPTPLDMFRFRDGTDDPATAADFTNPLFPRNMVPQHVAMTDQILGGSGGSVEALMSQGTDFGDGQQASHWKDSLGLGLMDPTAAFGESVSLANNDLRALDLIGYDIVVPEPATGLLAAAAAATLGSRRRRTRRAAAEVA